MRIQTTITHAISFSVQYFVSNANVEGGGMEHDTYGDDCNNLADALMILLEAKSVAPNNPWVIVCDAETLEHKHKEF